MASRASDWFSQAVRDLDFARRTLETEHYEWVCFVCQQAAEKAIKAVFQRNGLEAWGHSVSALLSKLAETLTIEDKLINHARELDLHYIPSRYPNSHPQGSPFEYYTRSMAKRSLKQADRIVKFCEGFLFRSENGSEED